MGQGILINFLVMTFKHFQTVRYKRVFSIFIVTDLQYGTYSTQYKLLNGKSSVQNQEVSQSLTCFLRAEEWARVRLQFVHW